MTWEQLPYDDFLALEGEQLERAFRRWVKPIASIAVQSGLRVRFTMDPKRRHYIAIQTSPGDYARVRLLCVGRFPGYITWIVYSTLGFWDLRLKRVEIQFKATPIYGTSDH